MQILTKGKGGPGNYGISRDYNLVKDWSIKFRFLAKARNFLVSATSLVTGPTQPFIQWLSGASPQDQAAVTLR
jgi:hypothetical protein